MKTNEHDAIALVVPSFNRAEALRVNLGVMLALRDVAEVIVVDDGSTDDTLEVCERFADERLRVISHPTNRGVAAARNTGIEAATGAWVLFGEDDCRFPLDYATVLRSEAVRHRADLVGAPLLHAWVTDEQMPQIAADAPRQEKPSMEDVGVFPYTAIETPFLPARALVRRSIFERIRFYEGFPVNGYREETDFFVQAARAGFRCLLTPATYCYQLDTWRGGQHNSSRLRYEYWTLRNNWSFLVRHGSWLAEQGYIRDKTDAQLRFAWGRLTAVASGATRTRLARARVALCMSERTH
jgi:glycosyltransferase involved in cell wall biosynthesis